MRIYSWNVNGIRAVWNKGLFQKFINDEKPDILCLQETKALKDQTEVDLPGYTEYWNSAEKKGYSGTAIFTKVEPINVVNGLPTEIINKYKVMDKAALGLAMEHNMPILIFDAMKDGSFFKAVTDQTVGTIVKS